ncbi:MAG: hypothetical protein FJ126_06035 [Deltaproteobacteria bacterium]|nr:hypothetical protein [Deltaproteobacteria bacterium]
MINLEEFRAGRFGVPVAGASELPGFCRDCPFLVQEQSQVCFCDGLFYYYCAYSKHENPHPANPPCLKTR